MTTCTKCSENFPVEDGYGPANEAVAHGMCTDCLEIAGYERCHDCEAWFPRAEIVHHAYAEDCCQPCEEKRESEARHDAEVSAYYVNRDYFSTSL